MVLAPPAPHAPFTAAPQYQNHFENVTVPRTPGTNTRELFAFTYIFRVVYLSYAEIKHSDCMFLGVGTCLFE